MSINDEIKNGRNGDSNPFVIQTGKFKNASLEDSFYHLDWAEESFLAGNHEKEMLRRTFDLDKLKYILGFMGVFILILAARAFWLQVARGSYYYAMAEGNRIRTEDIEARRGIIYDRNFRPLVRNEANFLLYLIPNDLPHNELERDNAIRDIGSILDSPAADSSASTAAVDGGLEKVGNLQLVSETSSFYAIKDKLDKIKLNSLDAFQPLFIADNIDYDKAIKLYMEADRIPGVFVSSKTRRDYLTGLSTSTPVEQVGPTSLAHILGYTGKINDAELKSAAENGENYSLIDYIGKTGLEYTYEKDLRGVAGQKNIEVDALGREKDIVSETAPQDGHNLLLSIDVELQKQAEDIVKSKLSQLGKSRASVVISDPNTGAILTLISWPAYDNNTFAKGIKQADYEKFSNNPDQPLFSRAISGNFPPGSTIKSVMAAAALQEGVINENTTVDSTGGLKLGGIWDFPDWKAGGHGITDVRKALAESINTFFYYIGGGYDNFPGLGMDRIDKYFNLFLLGKATGIDLPNENSGFVPTPQWKEATKKEKWYIGDIYHASIGQGDVTVTPLQVNNYTSFFANRGKIYKPYLVQRIMDKNNQAITKTQPQILAQDMIDQKNIEIVREGLRQTVTAGSAQSLKTVIVPVAGKTGTAQWSSTHEPQAWFTGFAPYANPQIVITVLVEEGGEGTTASVPIAHDIIDWYFKNRGNATSTDSKVN